MQLFRVTLRFFMAWEDPDIFRRMQESALCVWARYISFYSTVSPRIFRSIPLATNAATTLLAPHQPTHVPSWQDVLWRRRARAATSLRVCVDALNAIVTFFRSSACVRDSSSWRVNKQELEKYGRWNYTSFFCYTLWFIFLGNFLLHFFRVYRQLRLRK